MQGRLVHTFRLLFLAWEVDWRPGVTSSGILYPWTKMGKMVRTGTYQYVPVQHGTSQYENSSYVQGSMYQYIPVQAFNKTCDFPTNPERLRRDKIKVVQLLCIGYNITKAIFKTTQVLLFQSTYWYILVRTSTY